MNAWGGHRNGRIPLDQLEYVGIGVRSGQPQYLHPAVASAWRALQEAYRERGVSLLITEGYRTLELQNAYYAAYLARKRRPPAAAYPGSSNHGWATAIDMANYLGLPAKVRRPLIEAHGFSLATGDAVNEPWHIEYVGVLDFAGVGDTTPIRPTAPDPVEDEVFWLKHEDEEAWYLIAPGVATQIVTDRAAATLVSQVVMKGKSAQRATAEQITTLSRLCEASIPVVPTVLQWLKDDSADKWHLLAPGVKTQVVTGHADAALISQVVMSGRSAVRASAAQIAALSALYERGASAATGVDSSAVASAVVNELRDRL